tara:strand:+ start:769 stop:1599 length:831 start_codon:yes stop_codon:yes gene_type:complete
MGLGIGLALGAAGSLLSKGPKIPTYEKVDQAKEQGAAISSNLASFDKSRQLAEQTSAADQEILMANLERAMPGYGSLIGGASGAIGSMIAGRLPMADQGLLMRRAAESGVTGGIAGSQAGRNLTARDLGLSQMSMIQSGLGALNPFLSTVRSTAVANPMGVGASFITPQQWTQNAISENRFGYSAAVGKAQADAAGNPMNQLAKFASGAGGMMLGAHYSPLNQLLGGGGGGGGMLAGLRSGVSNFGSRIGNLFGMTGSTSPMSPSSSGGYYNTPRP